MRFRPRVWLWLIALLVPSVAQAQPAAIITGYMANPSGSDSAFEYIQFMAARDINFATTNFSVVIANNGVATTAGWTASGALTYGFNITTGTVKRGDTFYVGGSGKLINGIGTTSISGLTLGSSGANAWLRTIDTSTTGGDGLGSSGGTAGVFGNGGTNADGIAFFSGTTSGLTNSTTPQDSLFYGNTIGTAVVSSGSAGYQLANNDRYSGGKLQSTSFLFADPASGGYSRLTGSYQYTDNTWTTNRTLTNVASPTDASQIAQTSTVNHAMTWNVAGDGTWNNSLSSTNWTTTGGVATNFLNGDRATFSNTAGGTITIDAAGVTPQNVTVSAASGTYTFASGGTVGIAGTGTLTKLGAGTLTLTGANTYTGGTTLNGGTLALGSSGAIGTSGTISFGGGTLQYSAANTTDYSARFSTAASQAYGIDTNGQSVTLGSALSSGSGTLTKLGGGTLTLTGGNSYGTTTISAGTLQVGNGVTTGTLGGGAVVNNATLTFNRSDNFTVGNTISGSGGLTKLGGGILTLTGTNTYSGATNVNAGTLWVNGTSTGTGAVTVASGATLGGSGSLSGAVTVQGGGVVDAGNSVGTLIVNNNLTVSNGGTFRAELGAGTSADLVDLSGGANTLNLANGSTVNLVASGFTRTGTPATFTLADLNGTGASLLQLNGVNAAPDTVISTFTADGLGGGSFVTNNGSVTLTATGFSSLLNGDKLTLQRSSGGDLVLTFTPVPEPGTLLGVCALAAGGVTAVRRWRAKKQAAPAEVV